MRTHLKFELQSDLKIGLQVRDESNQPASFAQLKFSPKGDILTGVVGDKIYQLDSFAGGLQHKYSSGIPMGASPLEMCYSNDNKFLLSGEIDSSGEIDPTLYYSF